jgi:uncharacterized protein (DUF1330 family)
MVAYLIAEIDVTDSEAYAAYPPLAEASILARGGAYRVRGGAVEPLEGAPPAGRGVVLEFPDMDAARAWYSSEEYQAALPLRQAVSSGRAYFVEGVPAP